MYFELKIDSKGDIWLVFAYKLFVWLRILYKQILNIIENL